MQSDTEKARGAYLHRGRGRDAVEVEDGRRRAAVAARLLWVGVLLRRDPASVGLLLRASVPESGGEVEGDEAEDGVWEVWDLAGRSSAVRGGGR